MKRFVIFTALALSVAAFCDSAAIPETIGNEEAYRRWKADYAASMSRAALARALEPMDFTTSNGYVTADVDESCGEFDEGGDPSGTGGYMRLTYSWPESPGTEWALYYVDGYEGKTNDDLPAVSSSYMAGDTVFAVWDDWHGVSIRQEIVPVSLGSIPGDSEQIKFKAVITCADATEHDVGCIVYYDTMLDWNDAADISTAFGYTGIAEIFFDTTYVGLPPIWHAYENTYPPAPGDIVATGILTGYEAAPNPPNVFWYGQWGSSVGHGYGDSEWIVDTGSPFGDSATMVKWYAQTLTPGDSLIFVTYYGIGVVGTGIDISHEPPPFESDCGNVSPNPVDIDVLVTNGQTHDITDVFVALDLAGCDIVYSGGDPNPMHFSSIAGFGGTQIINWQYVIPPTAFGTTQCYDIIVTCTEDSTVTEHYCIDVPEALPLAEFDTIWFAQETDCDGEDIVEICYVINTCDDMPQPIDFEITTDGGISWFEPADTALRDYTGDLGSVVTGTHCFQWVLNEQIPGLEMTDLTVKVEFNDLFETRVLSATGPADSKPPELSFDCFPDTVFFGDTLDVSYSNIDMFPIPAAPETLIIYYCDGADTFAGSFPEDWTPQPVFCESAYVYIAMDDSFCNWSSDICYFSIISTGDIALSFPETTAAGCDTIDIIIAIDSLERAMAYSFVVNFSVNGDILEPISFTPLVSPAPATSNISGAGNDWTITLEWDSRATMTGANLGKIRFAVSCDAMGGDFSPLVITSVISELIESEWTNGVVMIEYSLEPWLEILRFDDTTDPQRRTTLSFGNAADADDLYDATFDLLYIPPPPTDIAAWFHMDDPEHPVVTKLSRDIRDMEPVNTWTVIVDNDAPVYIHWNPMHLDEGIFMLNGIQDMRADSDYIAESNETLTIVWRTPDVLIENMTVEAGWNLLSLLVHNPGGVPSSLFPGAFAGPFGYDTESGSYFIPDRLEPGLG
ncbi:hypothetical protein DRQ33_05350, partial [bacterium]